MKFVHIADLHLDVPFTNLKRNGLAEQRRIEQRNTIKKVIEYIYQNNIPYLFIAGDLYEHEYVRKSTINYINELFKSIPNTKIFITPGNHDPYLKNSYYNIIDWSSNVKIFSSNIEKISEKEFDLYGYGFEDFYSKNNKLQEFKIEDTSKFNILLTHGSINSSLDEEKLYNPITSKQLKQIGFGYIALGHIHKPYYISENPEFVYPGSLVSLGFDELGKHGMIVGNIEQKNVTIEFVTLDEMQFVEIPFIVDYILSKEELIEQIKQLNFETNKYYKIKLQGYRNFEINVYEIMKLINEKNLLKIKDETKLKIDLEQLEKPQNLKGIFVKNVLQQYKQGIIEEKIATKIIEIGIEAME